MRILTGNYKNNPSSMAITKLLNDNNEVVYETIGNFTLTEIVEKYESQNCIGSIFKKKSDQEEKEETEKLIASLNKKKESLSPEYFELSEKLLNEVNNFEEFGRCYSIGKATEILSKIDKMYKRLDKIGLKFSWMLN